MKGDLILQNDELILFGHIQPKKQGILTFSDNKVNRLPSEYQVNTLRISKNSRLVDNQNCV